jgi:hypothetical protein
MAASPCAMFLEGRVHIPLAGRSRGWANKRKNFLREHHNLLNWWNKVRLVETLATGYYERL